MEKKRLIKTALCLVLAFTMTFAPIFSSYAVVATALAGEVQTTESQEPAATDEAAPSDEGTTAEPSEEVQAQPSDVPAPGTVEDQDVQPEEEAVETEEEEEEAEAVKTDYVWKDEKVKVTAKLSDAAAIPDDAKFIATPIVKESTDYNYDAYMEALNKDSDSKYDESNTLLYDIAFIKDGVELQPESGKVSVTFEFFDKQLAESIGAKKAADVNVIHLPLTDEIKDKYDTTADAKKIEAEDVKVEAVTKEDNELKVSVRKEKIIFETESFSAYAVVLDNGVEDSLTVQFKTTEGTVVDNPLTDKYYYLLHFTYNNQDYFYLEQIDNFNEVLSLGESQSVSYSQFKQWNGTQFDGTVEGNLTVDASIVFNKNYRPNGLSLSDLHSYGNDYCAAKEVDINNSIGIYKLSDIKESNTDDGKAVTFELKEPVHLGFKTEAKNSDGEYSPAETSYNYYALYELSDSNSYSLQKLDFTSSPNPSEVNRIDYFTDSSGQGKHYYDGSEKYSVSFVRSEKDNLSLSEAVNGTDCVKLGNGQITEGYTIGLANDGTVTTLSLTKMPAGGDGVDHTVTIDFYDKDEVHVVPADPALTGNYYILATLTPNGTKNKGTVQAWSITPVSISEINSNGETVTVINKSFYLCDAGGGKISESDTVNFDPNLFDINIRLYHSDELPADYNTVIRTGDDTVEGYDFMKNDQSDNETSSHVSLHKSFAKDYDIKLRFDPEGTELTSGDQFYLYVTVDHKTTGTDYFLTPITSSGEDTITYDLGDMWKKINSGDTSEDITITGREKITIQVIKANDGPYDSGSLGNNGLQGKNYTVIDGERAKDYRVSYDADRETVENVETETTHITDYVDFSKILVSNDYNFATILGTGINYGITADYFYQNGHIQSNFAANTYEGHNIIEPDLAGTGSAIVIANGVKDSDGYILEIGDSHVADTNTVVYLGNGDASSVRNINDRPWVYVVPSDPDDLTNGVVEPIINHGDDISTELLTHNTTITPDSKYIDLLDFPEDATIYLDGDDLAYWIAKGDDGLYITKHPDQVIVFNFDSTENVKLGQYHIRYERDDEYQVSNSPTGKGDSVNDFMDYLAQHMVYNLASVKDVTIDTMVGIVLVPDEESKTIIEGTSAGWIISDGYVRNNGAEWHSVYSDLPDLEYTNLHVFKTVDGKTPTGNQKFTFTIDHLANSESGNTWTPVMINPSGSSEEEKYQITNTNGAIQVDGIRDLATTWNIYRISETAKADSTEGSYTLDSRNIYAVVKYEELTSSGNNTVHIAGIPTYYIETSDATADGAILFDKNVFDINAATIEAAFGDDSDKGDDAITIVPITKPTFINHLEQTENSVQFNIIKILNGITGSEKEFTFVVKPESADAQNSDKADKYTQSDTVTITGAGTASFETITYSAPGSYVYTLKESVDESDTSYSYDRTEYRITVTITANDEGKLSKTYSINKVKDRDGNELVPVIPIISVGGITVSYTNTYTQNKGSVEVRKVFSGADALPAAFKITNDYNDEEFTVANASSGTGTAADPYIWTITDIPVGTQVTFTESGENIPNYTLSATASPAGGKSAAVVKDETQTVVLTNTYTQNKGSLKVTKSWNGVDSSTLTDAQKAKLSFTVTGPYNYSNTFTYAEMPNGEMTISDLPVGEYTVVETGADQLDINGVKYKETTYSVTGGKTAVAKDDTSEVTVTNTYVADINVNFEATKIFELGDLATNEFTFSVYAKDGDKETKLETVTGTTKAPAAAVIADAAQGAVQAAAAADGESGDGTEGDSSEPATTPETKKTSGPVYFTPIKYTLDDLKKADGTYESSKTFTYVIKEDVPKNAKEVTIGGTRYFYDSTTDILYDTAEKKVTVTLRLNDNVLTASKVYDGDKAEFTNKKEYTKLSLTKSIDKFIGEDTDGEYVNATLVFRLTYDDPITGEKGKEREVSVQFDKDNVTSQTIEVEKIPIDTAVEIKEIYSSNYKPGATATATKEIKDGYPVWTVSVDNTQIGTTTGSGIINNVGKSEDGSYEWNVGDTPQDEPKN